MQTIHDSDKQGHTLGGSPR